ncbi:hydroxylamine reductase [Arabiibacter massiliensis]|uniref:hydroxylamine reductase n=1 Tax=Arabiibacter massiliensis TaxID=1870985 RepID=UPI0009BA1916|nr:hydroxylamine reductase [Arabiibacter massiliensis]
MDTTMFCFQCEQTAGCAACTGAAGVCGKTAATAQVQDELTGALVGLALTVEAAKAAGGTDTAARTGADDVAMEGLFATLTNVDFDDASLRALIDRAHAERDRIAAAAGISAAPDYDLARLWNAPEDVRSLKSLVLFGLRGLAAYAYHAAALGYRDEAVSAFLHEGLAALADDAAGADALLPLALRVGEANLRCMELLDQANTETFGTPEPTQVARTVEPGPFVVVSGHDLLDLKLVLDQTAGRGVNVYTHGELLPAHAYPLFKQYPHLKGNLGTAWQNQREEFADLPAPILFTTNCLMPPAASYADRVFTTGPVAFPGMARIGADKDFGPVIERALELGGFAEPQAIAAEAGAELTTGFGHGTILGVADAVVDAVKQGAISHFYLVGGCDGARPGRSRFREFVQQTPADSVVLTLACGKFRFNDLDLGTVAGLPRLMDMGQCNDAYGAIRVALALAEAFECGVNDLPLTLVLSWYEQKAVSILLSLLHLGIKGIYLGPTLPAFVSPAVLDVLVREFDVRPLSALA